MHISRFSPLIVLPALAVASAIPAPSPSELESLTTPAPEAAIATPAPAAETEKPQLELRQAAGNDNLGTTQAATQAATVNTAWVETTIGSSTTYIEVIYTQTFASVPDQMTTAGVGTIGLGTITGTVGVVKESKNGGAVLAPGTLLTASLAAVGVAIGMGAMLL
ncbi:hypothetical protein MBLNU459_g3216t1 [Dothideomycetes sp. NU459]